MKILVGWVGVFKTKRNIKFTTTQRFVAETASGINKLIRDFVCSFERKAPKFKLHDQEILFIRDEE